jgi:hypothetical protein
LRQAAENLRWFAGAGNRSTEKESHAKREAFRTAELFFFVKQRFSISRQRNVFLHDPREERL